MKEHPQTAALLSEARGDNTGAQSKLVNLVYDELRAIAARHMRRQSPGHTLQPTSLVNEAYVRIAAGSSVNWHDELHFRAVAAVAMRHVLVDHARARRRRKRGGDRWKMTLDTSMLGASGGLEVLELEDALAALEREDERAAQVCMLRLFGGLTIERVAQRLDTSTATVERDWRFARAWLYDRVYGDPSAGGSRG